MNNLQEYNSLTANEIGGDFSTKYVKYFTLSMLQIFYNECGVSTKEF